MNKTFFIFVTILLGLLACETDRVDLGKLEVTEVNYFDTLQNWMSGSFSNALQAENDTNYYDVNLEMHSIWEDNDSIFYLYVEQSLASMTDKPYRQHVYKVQKTDDGFRKDVYELNNPDRFIGQWLNASLWMQYNPDSILLKVGCGVNLDWSGEYFQGETDSATCISSIRGASYVISQVEVLRDRIISREQGYDITGAQVWGAEQNDYVFLGNQ